MKTVTYALAIWFATFPVTYAQNVQTRVTGTWRVEGRTSGDEMAFTWALQVQDGGNSPAAADGIVGASAARRFTAKRVPDDSDAELVKTADQATDQRRGQVDGVEFAAAVNLLQNDVKVIGTLFLPQKATRVRAVIVVLRWGNGSFFYPDPDVRRLSETTESGLLLTDFATMTVTPTNYRPSYGQDRADGLLMLLRRLAQESGHQELTNVPLLFWGHSAAGPFGASFAASYPERTIAFVRYHSGPVLGGDLKVVSQVPALFLIGGKDPTLDASGTPGVEGAKVLWTGGRAVGAPWTLSLDPDADHSGEESLRKANALVIPWITAVLRQRLSSDGGALRAVTDGSGWFGNNQTGEAAPFGTFIGSKPEASWLPDEPSARGWRAVMGAAK